MKWSILSLFLLNTAVCYADEDMWNFLEVNSGYGDGGWEIFRSSAVPILFSRGTFSTTAFDAQSDKSDNHIHAYEVQGAIEKSSSITGSIYGDDVIATFVPQETEAGPVTCKGKYLRQNTNQGLVEEMNFLCNGSADFRSFKRITKKK
jgi:hypothetical protein